MQSILMNFSVKEVSDALDIYEISAKELLDGTIQFDVDELVELAKYKGVTLGKLLHKA